jgi:hypothetical protein
VGGVTNQDIFDQKKLKLVEDLEDRSYRFVLVI